MKSTLKRVNSGGPSNVSSAASVFKSGNLDSVRRHVEDLSDEDLSDIELEEADNKHDVSFQPLSLDDYKKADNMFREVFGVPIIENFTQLILKEKMTPKDIVVQSLAYQVMKQIRGSSGVRYLESYGMYWTGVRNIVKTAGLVPFLDHFSIPTVLSKYKKKILNLCGLKEETLGKPGLQERNVEHWMNAKINETKCNKLCISVSIDGKKIAMSSDGLEDMGTTNGKTVDEMSLEDTSELIKALDTKDRKKLFAAYDSLTSTAQEVATKIVGIHSLIKKNEKLSEKNPLLLKYIFVLNQQLKKGNQLIQDTEILQLKVLHMLCEKRRSSSMLPSGKSVNLSSQENYRKLIPMCPKDDQENVQKIRKLSGGPIYKYPWSKLILKNRKMLRVPQKSKSFQALLSNCYLVSDDIFNACGLNKVAPLQGMKSVYKKSNSNDAEIMLHYETSLHIVATVSAIISPMIFGNKCYLAESGMAISNGIASTPSLIVYNTSDELEYVVRTVLKDENMFQCKLETIATCLIDAYLFDSKTGCLLIQHSNKSCVSFMIPRSDKLAEEMLSIVSGYTKADKCIAKRSKELILRINTVRVELNRCLDSCSILGSFPMVENVISSDAMNNEVKDYLLTPGPKSPSHSTSVPDVQVNSLKKDVSNLIQAKYIFLSKKARELLAINASDMAGINSSSLPHTILCGTFLTSNSLKVVGNDCLDSAIKLINSSGGEV